jgi:hypothetical protein
MTNLLKTSTIAVAALFAMSGVASAEGVTINLAGKDAHAVRAEIVKAAYKVCRDSGSEYTDFPLASETQCINDTIVKAEADFKQASSTRMATAETSARAGER